jgi:CRISPR/Cas system Type II protein with McrA/HNH and RuvC-like nuclease domain
MVRQPDGESRVVGSAESAMGRVVPFSGRRNLPTARKPVLPVPQRKTAAAEAIKKKAFMPWWAWSAGAIFVCVGVWGMHSWSCPVHRLVERHQDGNDRFYLLNHSALDDVKPHAAIKMIQQDLDIEAEYNHQSDKEMDMHFLVQIDVDDEVIASLNKLRYRITDEIEIEGHRFVLMSNESDDRDRE